MTELSPTRFVANTATYENIENQRQFKTIGQVSEDKYPYN